MRGLINRTKYTLFKLLFILNDDLKHDNFIKKSSKKRVIVFSMNEYEKEKRANGVEYIRIDNFTDKFKLAECDIGIALNEETLAIFILKHRKLKMFSTVNLAIHNELISNIKKIINDWKYDLQVARFLGLSVGETMSERVSNELESKMIEEEENEITEAKKFLNRYK